jgi:hypothetical protein
MKLCRIYRMPGDKPDMSPFAQGAFVNGHLIDFKTPTEFSEKDDEEPADLVAVSGGLNRYYGANGRIVEHYVSKGTPTIICEFGRLVPKTQMLLLNAKPWLPPEGEYPDNRRMIFDLKWEFYPRGEDILVCGQRPDLDVQLEKPVEDLKKTTGRRVVYRPHPNMWRLIDREGKRPDYLFPPADEISNRCDSICDETERDLEHDLQRAWCVVTHSSIVAITAALRGIPSVATQDCPAADICYPPYTSPDDIRPIAGEPLRRFLNRFAHTVWTEDEIRFGTALKFYMEHFS